MTLNKLEKTAATVITADICPGAAYKGYRRS